MVRLIELMVKMSHDGLKDFLREVHDKTEEYCEIEQRNNMIGVYGRKEPSVAVVFQWI